MQERRNFQSSLNLQQTYSMALCSHINNIYNKLAEIQQQLPHSTQHMNTGGMIQIEVPDFDPDIDEALPIPVDQNTDHEETQGSANSIQQFSQHEITHPQTKPLVLAVRHRSLCKYLARGKVRCAGKSFMDINPLEQEQDHCKAESSKRLRKPNVCARGMRTLNNFFVQ